MRARRWMRRHRKLVASTAAASAVVALFGLATVLAVQSKLNRDVREANRHLLIANGREQKANADLRLANAGEKAAREKAQARYDLANRRHRVLLHGGQRGRAAQAARAGVPPQPIAEDRPRLLQAAARYPRLGPRCGPEVRTRPSPTPAIGWRVSPIPSARRRMLSPLSSSRGRSRRGCSKAGPADEGIRLKLAGDLNQIGDLQRTFDRPDEAVKTHQEALTLCKELDRARPGSPKVRNVLGWVWYCLGLAQRKCGDKEGALRLPAGVPGRPRRAGPV